MQEFGGGFAGVGLLLIALFFTALVVVVVGGAWLLAWLVSSLRRRS